MNSFTLLFVSLLGLSVLLRLWLAGRHLRHVTAHRPAVPVAFRDRISLADHQKAADYTRAGVKLGMIELLYGTLLLLLWTLGGGLDLLGQWWSGLGLGGIATGIAILVSAFTIMAILDLPAQLYSTFVLEERFGFNRTTPATFVSDLLKHTLLLAALGIPLAWVALTLMAQAGSLWWLYLWAVWVSFSLFMMWAYPAFIAPLFNRFSPLEDDALRARIQRLLDQCGFRSQGIFVMDGSRRSGHGNAYFTGFGRNKRIVFFDTLLKDLEPAEIEAVLAHELGHFKRKHVQKRLLSMMAMSLAGLALLGWLIEQPWFYQGLGVTQASHAMALLLFLLVSPVFTFFLQPLFAFWSRRHEFEADEYAAQQANAQDLIKALVKLYQENASTLTPDPLYSAFHDSHPPAPVRVAHLTSRLQPA
jgi:STE24 endopeptidase